MAATIKDIAKKTGLGLATISSYLNGSEYRSIIMELAQGTNINNLRNEHIDKLMIPIPNEVQQAQFIQFSEQSDKSKFVVSNRNLSRCLVKSTQALGLQKMQNMIL